MDARIPWSKIQALLIMGADHKTLKRVRAELCEAANLDAKQLQIVSYENSMSTVFEDYDIIFIGGTGDIEREQLRTKIVRSKIPCWGFEYGAWLLNGEGATGELKGSCTLTPDAKKDPVFGILPDSLTFPCRRALQSNGSEEIPLVVDDNGNICASRLPDIPIYTVCFNPLFEKELIFRFIQTYVAWPEFLA